MKMREIAGLIERVEKLEERTGEGNRDLGKDEKVIQGRISRMEAAFTKEGEDREELERSLKIDEEIQEMMESEKGNGKESGGNY
jgi:hypothetical protein